MPTRYVIIIEIAWREVVLCLGGVMIEDGESSGERERRVNSGRVSRIR